MQTSVSSCNFHQRLWRSHLNALRLDTGIPAGLRLSTGGHIHIGSSLGGSITIEFETAYLRNGESFIMFVGGEEVIRV